MKRTVKNLLDIARGEIGYHEKKTNANLDQKTAPNDGAGNYTKYGPVTGAVDRKHLRTI